MEFIVGLIVFIADIWAIMQILQSSSSGANKLVWVLVILLLPVLGLIIWYFLGPRGTRI